MSECENNLERVGVAQKGGKKYMMVKDRMTFFRRAYGLTYGISTALIHSDDLRVQVQATVTDAAGHTIGSGLAEEIRGGGGVNKSSAIENCESSAIGRALASLGLHGGEYPTADEIESDRRSSKAIDEKPQVNQPMLVSEDIPFDKSDAKPDWSAWVQDQIAGMAKHRHVAEHASWLDATQAARNTLKQADLKQWDRLKVAYVARKNEMLNKTEG
jgi:hypothetical protein